MWALADYIEKGDLTDDAPYDKFDTGVMVISLTWESVMGSVQSNQARLGLDTSR